MWYLDDANSVCFWGHHWQCLSIQSYIQYLYLVNILPHAILWLELVSQVLTAYLMKILLELGWAWNHVWLQGKVLIYCPVFTQSFICYPTADLTNKHGFIYWWFKYRFNVLVCSHRKVLRGLYCYLIISTCYLSLHCFWYITILDAPLSWKDNLPSNGLSLKLLIFYIRIRWLKLFGKLKNQLYFTQCWPVSKEVMQLTFPEISKSFFVPLK